MINEDSFQLFDKLVKENYYNNINDLGIIFEITEFLNENDLDLVLSNDDFMRLCNEVKRQYLKSDADVTLNYDFISGVYYNILKEEGKI